MKAQYRNSIRSKNLIREATFRLLAKKTISEITVSDIVREANINRGTFYNHYNNPTEILIEIKDELMDSLSQGLRLSVQERNMDGFLNTVSEHFQKNEDLYRCIVNSIPMSLIDHVKKEFIKQLSNLNFGLDNLAIHFIINGIAGIHLDYLKNNIKYDYKDIKDICREYIELSITKFIKQP